MKHFNLILCIIAFLTINTTPFLITDYLNEGAATTKSYGIILPSDFNNDGSKELVLSQLNADSAFQLFYQQNQNHRFELVHQNRLFSWYWIAGTGDFDDDGLFEILGANPDSHYIYTMEQSDSFSFPDSITWHSDTIYKTFRHLKSSYLMKPDSLYRIVGTGIPDTSTPTYAYGWYIYNTIGDNDYQITEEYEREKRIEGCFDEGDMDFDGLLDVILNRDLGRVSWYEAVDSNADSFVELYTTDLINQPRQYKILNDIDNDGNREFALLRANQTILPDTNVYHLVVFEDTSGTNVLDTIFSLTCKVHTDYYSQNGCRIDDGDIDGDGNIEFAVSMGRHLEVWKATGDNTFNKVFEWTNPSYNTIASGVLCYDFDKDGADEIVYSGCEEMANSETYVFADSAHVFNRDTLHIDSAVVYDSRNVQSGLDYDDFLCLYFDKPTSTPDINTGNINSILRLSDNHTYLDGDSNAVIWWGADKYKLLIRFTTSNGEPTLAIGDTIYPDSVSILNEWLNCTCMNPVVITGSFGPSGIEDNITEYTENTISIQNNTVYYTINKPNSSIIITDILGRVLYSDESIEPGDYVFKANGLNNGVYFIKLQDNHTTLTKKYLNIK